MRRMMTGLALALGLMSLGAATAPAVLVERQETRADQDLSAQVGMQLAAEEMIRLTRWQLFLGWVTAAGLAGTLMMTARSLRQTRTSLVQAQGHAEVQLRPYLGMEIAEMPKPGEPGAWRLKWRMKNYGQTAAINVRAWNRSEIVMGQPDEHEMPEPALDAFTSAGVVQPGGTLAQFRDLANRPDYVKNELLAGTRSLVTATVVVYEDCFGNTHCLRHSEIRYGPDMMQHHFNLPFMHRPPPG